MKKNICNKIAAILAVVILTISTMSMLTGCVETQDDASPSAGMSTEQEHEQHSAHSSKPALTSSTDPTHPTTTAPTTPTTEPSASAAIPTTTTAATTVNQGIDPVAPVDKPDMNGKPFGKGSSGTAVKNTQARLRELGYLSDKADGKFGQNTENAVKAFQYENGMEVTGIVDEYTMSRINADDAIKAKVTYDHEDVQKPDYSKQYYVVVYTPSNTTLILGKDEYGKYNKVERVFCCSTGKDDTGNCTPAGLYKIDKRYEWQAMFGGVYAQYAVRFYGNYLFHSVPYYTNKDHASLEMDQFEMLGSRASLGCVRLCVRDAKWIYDNLKDGTQVRVINDKEGPAATEEIPDLIHDDIHAGWDPTDPDPHNPYLN